MGVAVVVILHVVIFANHPVEDDAPLTRLFDQP